LRVFISDITVIRSRHDDSVYYELVGQLQSGLEIYVNSYHYDLEGYIGRNVEMLLCVLRSPYLERGKKAQLFLPEKYYSIELIDELLKEKGQSPGTNEKEIILTGEFIDTYIIPEEWVPLITPRSFQLLLTNPSAIKTEDGVFLLNPLHLRKRIPIERFPQVVSIATGSIDLAAWHPL
jgi:hypothetical protein